MAQLNHPRPSRQTVEEIHSMTDAQLTGTIAGVKRRAGAKRKHKTEYDATDRVNEQITQHGRPTTRRRTTYKWRKDDLARYLDCMYVCKFSTAVEYGTRGQLVPIRLSPFRDPKRPKCILPHFREFLTPSPLLSFRLHEV